MASNPINVNSQMQQFADNAVVAARDKFGVSLDFSEASLQQLEALLQQAHGGYQKASANTPIENTVRVWGAYLGEVIRRNMGGDWIVDQKNVFLQTGSRRLDPIGQVRSCIVSGPEYNLVRFYQGLIPGGQAAQAVQPTKITPDNTIQKSNGKQRKTSNSTFMILGGLLGVIILVSLCIVVVWVLSRQGVLAIPGMGTPVLPTPYQTAILAPTATLTSTTVPTSTITPTFTISPTPRNTDTPFPTATDWILPSPTSIPPPTLTAEALSNSGTATAEAILYLPKKIGPMYDSIQESTYSAQVKITQVGWLYSSGFETPKTGNEYLVVYITIKNLGPDAIHSLSPTDFQALDSNGVVHDSAYLTSLTDCYPDIVDLLPNGTMSGCIPFEVPLNGRIEFIYAPFNYEGLVSGRYLSFIVRP